MRLRVRVFLHARQRFADRQVAIALACSALRSGAEVWCGRLPGVLASASRFSPVHKASFATPQLWACKV